MGELAQRRLESTLAFVWTRRQEEEGSGGAVSPELWVKCRIAAERLFVTTWPSMTDGMHLATWVSKETKERFAAVARYQGLSDSALLKRMIELTLQSTDAVSMTKVVTDEEAARASRLTVRLRPDDQMLLRERASSRGMAPATYVSVLVRSHLRSLAPLPKEELLAVKKAIAELGGIGRNLNQIARAANQGERVSGPGREQVSAMIRVCEGLRDHVKELLSANLRSWEQGHAGWDH